MYAVVKQYCISNGPARFLEIIKADESNECIALITTEEWPKGNIETRGMNPALLCAHNLTFDRRAVDSRIKPVEGFSALYMTNGQELFFIEYDGEKAVLNVLDMSKARKLYEELPQKLISANNVFDPVAAQAEAKNARQANESLKASEKRRAEIREWEELGPIGRFQHPEKEPK